MPQQSFQQYLQFILKIEAEHYIGLLFYCYSKLDVKRFVTADIQRIAFHIHSQNL